MTGNLLLLRDPALETANVTTMNVFKESHKFEKQPIGRHISVNNS